MKENIPGLMLFIDFQKAFDSVEWEFLFKCLEAFNFGPDFLHWVKVFYKNIQSCILNNGMTSSFFTLKRGVRQGDPLSPYLFVVAVETLAIAIRQNSDMKGIYIEEQETKLLQYADDTTAILADTNSAKVLFELLDRFRNISGLKINCSKTEGMWIGSLKESKEEYFGIKWPKIPIKALGVYFTYDQKLLKEKNFIETLDSIKKLINIWSSRCLSIYGKVTIIKSFLIPKFVYVCSLLPTPKEIVNKLNQLLFKFLWNGTDKVTRVSVINDYEKGGLKMIDLESMVKSLRLAWLKRLFNDSNATWKTYLLHLLKPVGGKFFLNCNYEVSDYTISSQFYQELLLWWSEFRESFASESDWKIIVWNNKEIRIDNKPVYYKNYFKSGIIYIHDQLFNWDTVFVDNDIDASIACWYDMFLSCVDEFVPKVVIKDANRPPWIDKEVLLLIRKKNRTRRKAKLKNSVHLWERFRELRRQVKKMVKFKKRSHLSKLSCSLGDNPRKFWSYYKTITKTTRIPRVIKHESVQATRPIDQANLFNIFFPSVFAPPDSSSAAIYLPRLNYSVRCELSEVRFTPSNILKQLQSLDVNKASLGLPSKLLQACANEISPSLCRLFNLSLELGTFPEKWKDANLVPIHKCESKSMVSNYGGISLLDVLSKILERQVYNEIFDIICPHLTHWQHGFLPGKSTVSQLSQVLHHFAVALERRQQVDVIYLDFSKAFDRVSHEKLL